MFQENEKLIKEYGMLRKFDDSKKFLMDGRMHLGKAKTFLGLQKWKGLYIRVYRKFLKSLLMDQSLL